MGDKGRENKNAREYRDGEGGQSGLLEETRPDDEASEEEAV
jgi:hypothetical protein